MAAGRLRSSYHVCCLLLSFSHAIGQHLSRDVNNEMTLRSYKSTTKTPSTCCDDVTQNVVRRSTAATSDVIETVADVTYPLTAGRRLRKAAIQYRVGDNSATVDLPWTRELAARVLQELEQDVAAATTNCSISSSAAVQSLNVELPVPVLGRFSAEAASAVHAANVMSLLLQSPGGATSQRDAFYFSFARAIVESSGDLVNSVTLVQQKPDQSTIGARAARFSTSTTVTNLLRVRVSDVGRPEWYNGLLQRSRGDVGNAERCGQDSWTSRDVGNKSTVTRIVSELSDVTWSAPYVVCPSAAMVSLIVPIYACRPPPTHSVVIRSEAPVH